MHIKELNHVNLRTQDLAGMIDWYVNVLGLKNGYRPAFPFAGAWLYAGDTPVVHLVEVETPPGAGSDGDLKLEHFAFAASGAAQFEQRLQAHKQKFRKSGIEEIGLVAFNVWDPDGNHIHVDFQTDEDE